MTPSLLLTALLAALAPAQLVEPTRQCPNLEARTRAHIETRLAGTYWPAKRASIAKELAERTFAEAKRRNLDPLVLTTIAWIESDFRPYTRGKFKRPEVGVWQIIPGDNFVNAARDRLLGCEPIPTPIQHQLTAGLPRQARHHLQLTRSQQA